MFQASGRLQHKQRTAWLILWSTSSKLPSNSPNPERSHSIRALRDRPARDRDTDLNFDPLMFVCHSRRSDLPFSLCGQQLGRCDGTLGHVVIPCDSSCDEMFEHQSLVFLITL